MKYMLCRTKFYITWSRKRLRKLWYFIATSFIGLPSVLKQILRWFTHSKVLYHVSQSWTLGDHLVIFIPDFVIRPIEISPFVSQVTIFIREIWFFKPLLSCSSSYLNFFHFHVILYSIAFRSLSQRFSKQSWKKPPTGPLILDVVTSHKLTGSQIPPFKILLKVGTC